MRGNRVSIVLALICLGFVIGSVYSFFIPHQIDQLILEGDNFGILNDLNASFHTGFPWNSYNQSIDIFFTCTEGALDIVVLKGTEWNAWNSGGNYTAFYERRNVTSGRITIMIEPSEYHTVYIILQTNYGDARMAISMYGHCLGYNYSTGVISLLVAIPFAIGSFHFTTKKPEPEDRAVGIEIS